MRRLIRGFYSWLWHHKLYSIAALLVLLSLDLGTTAILRSLLVASMVIPIKVAAYAWPAMKKGWIFNAR